jgi:hypothetical protein
MPASSSITARAVASGLSRSLAIAACSVPTDRCRVHRSNKINRVVLEAVSLVISNDRCYVGCWQILLQKWAAPYQNAIIVSNGRAAGINLARQVYFLMTSSSALSIEAQLIP